MIKSEQEAFYRFKFLKPVAVSLASKIHTWLPGGASEAPQFETEIFIH